jgi:hypothetical protein
VVLRLVHRYLARLCGGAEGEAAVSVVYTLLVAHFVGDFICQSDWMALNKSKRWDALAVHVGVYGLVLWAALIPWVIAEGPFWSAFLTVNTVAHFAQDALRNAVCDGRMVAPVMAEVIWSGTLERAAAEQARYQPPPVPPKVSPSDMVLHALSRGELTVPELVEEIGLTQNAVCSAIYNLRCKGLVRTGTRRERTIWGRWARGYVRV